MFQDEREREKKAGWSQCKKLTVKSIKMATSIWFASYMVVWRDTTDITITTSSGQKRIISYMPQDSFSFRSIDTKLWARCFAIAHITVSNRVEMCCLGGTTEHTLLQFHRLSRLAALNSPKNSEIGWAKQTDTQFRKCHCFGCARSPSHITMWQNINRSQ